MIEKPQEHSTLVIDDTPDGSGSRMTEEQRNPLLEEIWGKYVPALEREVERLQSTINNIAYKEQEAELTNKQYVEVASENEELKTCVAAWEVFGAVIKNISFCQSCKDENDGRIEEAIQSARSLLKEKPEKKEICDHHWVNAENEHVHGTAMCIHCYGVAPLGAVVLNPYLPEKVDPPPPGTIIRMYTKEELEEEKCLLREGGDGGTAK